MKNKEYSHNERVKKCYQQVDFVKNFWEVETFLSTFGISSNLMLLQRQRT